MRQMHRDGKFPPPAGAPRGELHHNHKLTAADVQAIRVLLDEGKLSLAAVARQFGVGRKTISKIRDGLTWNWVTKGPTDKPIRTPSRDRTLNKLSR